MNESIEDVTSSRHRKTEKKHKHIPNEKCILTLLGGGFVVGERRVNA